MKGKRILKLVSIILSIALLVTMLPVQTFAAELYIYSAAFNKLTANVTLLANNIIQAVTNSIDQSQEQVAAQVIEEPPVEEPVLAKNTGKTKPGSKVQRFLTYQFPPEEVQNILDENEDSFYSSLSKEEQKAVLKYYETDDKTMLELDSKGQTLGVSIDCAIILNNLDISTDLAIGAVAKFQTVLEAMYHLSDFVWFVANQKMMSQKNVDELMSYVLDGHNPYEISSAIILSRALKTTVDAILTAAENNVKTIDIETEQKKKNSKFENLAITLNTDADSIMSEVVSEKADISSVEQSVEDEFASFYGLNMAMSTQSAPPTEYKYPEMYPNAPFEYDKYANEGISLNSGALTLTETDAIIPGMNGLDLVLARRYDSDYAYKYTHYAEINYQLDVETKYVLAYTITRYNGCTANPYVTSYAEYFSSYEEAYNRIIQVYVQYDDDNWNSGVCYNVSNYSIDTQYFFSFIPYVSFMHALRNPIHDSDFSLDNTTWNFAFSFLRSSAGQVYFFPSTGGQYLIDWSTYSGFRGYDLQDMKFETISEIVEGAGSSSHRVTYKDGKREYFDAAGRLIAIKDRYNNMISFAYTSSSVPNEYDITITDTVGRTLTIVNSINSSGSLVKTATLPDDSNSTIAYTMSNGAGDKLISVKNQMEDIESFAYDEVGLEFSIDLYSISNYYNKLMAIYYPTGAKKEYTYSVGRRNLGDGGYEDYFRVASRKDSFNNGATVANHKTYAYEGNYTGDYTGGYSPSDLPLDYTFSTTITTVLTGATAKNIFNYKQECTTEEYRNNGQLYMQVAKEYNSNHQPTIVTLGEPDLNSAYKRIEKYAYNSKGDVTEYYGPLAGDAYNTEYKITFTYYDSNYSLPNTTTYKVNASTTIVETNSLDGEGKSIALSTVTENGVTKEKIGFIYDSNGNITSTTVYTSGSNWNDNYTLSSYSYEDGLLESVTKSGVVTGDIINDIPVLAKGSSGNNDGIITESFGYDNIGRMTSRVDANGNTYTYTYNNIGHLTKIDNPDATEENYTYDYDNNIKTVTNTLGKTIWYQYDPLGRLLEVRLDSSTGTLLNSNTYDELSRLTIKANNTESGTTSASKEYYYYDYRDRVYDKQIKDANNDTQYHETYSYSYDTITYESASMPCYKVTKTVIGESGSSSPAPSITTKEYTDKYGRMIRTGRIDTINSVDQELYDEFWYDYAGSKVKELSHTDRTRTSPLTFTNKYIYDYAGRVVRIFNAGNETNYTETTYNELGKEKTSRDKAGSITNYEYDKLGRLIKQITPFEGSFNSVAKTYYDAIGNAISKKTLNSKAESGQMETWNETVYTYNNRNMLISTILKNSGSPANFTVYYHDAAGNVIRMYNGLGSTLTASALYTGFETGQYTAYSYDGGGNITGIESGLSSAGTDTVSTGDSQYATTKYAYDSQARLKKMTDPVGLTETYAYDNNSMMTAKVDKKGQMVTYAYNALAKVTSESVNTNPTISKTYAYHKTGALAEGSTGSISTDYTYDKLGRLKTETDGTYTNSYTYDTSSNRDSYTLTYGSTTMQTDYEYDTLNRLDAVESGNIRAEYGYDVNGNRTSVEYKNGANFNSEVYTYNKANMVKTLNNKQGTTILSSFSYDYKVDGNQWNKTKVVGSDTTVNEYEYDYANQLTSESESVNGCAAQVTSYAYDDFSNRTQMTEPGNVVTNYYYTNALGQYTGHLEREVTAGVITTYEYDLNGNQTSKTTPQTVGKIVEVNSYNGLNQLTNYVKDTYNDSDEIVLTSSASYTYKTNGLRSSKTVGTVTTTHVWDGTEVVLDICGDSISKFVRGLNLVAQITDTETSYYLHDAHGDVVHLTNTSGAVVRGYNYDAFGNTTASSGTVNSPFRYCGEYLDSETGYIYLRGRYYDTRSGRFITEDPMKDGVSWYAYCANNPINLFDPSGYEITAADQAAYDNGSLSQANYIMIINATNLYNAAAQSNDYETMNRCRIMAVAARRIYDPNYVDNYDYSHGGAYLSQTANASVGAAVYTGASYQGSGIGAGMTQSQPIPLPKSITIPGLSSLVAVAPWVALVLLDTVLILGQTSSSKALTVAEQATAIAEYNQTVAPGKYFAVTRADNGALLIQYKVTEPQAILILQGRVEGAEDVWTMEPTDAYKLAWAAGYLAPNPVPEIDTYEVSPKVREPKPGYYYHYHPAIGFRSHAFFGIPIA